jgi:hypothetical protein
LDVKIHNTYDLDDKTKIGIFNSVILDCKVTTVPNFFEPAARNKETGH